MYCASLSAINVVKGYDGCSCNSVLARYHCGYLTRCHNLRRYSNRSHTGVSSAIGCCEVPMDPRSYRPGDFVPSPRNQAYPLVGKSPVAGTPACGIALGKSR
jgi:hypothetical protein